MKPVVISKFDEVNVNLLRKEILEVARAVAEKYGVDVLGAGGTFIENEATLKLKLTVKSESGETKSQSDFRLYAPSFGLKAEDLNKIFRTKTESYQIVGWNVSVPKRTVLLRRLSDGKSFDAPPETVAHFLHRVVT